MVAKIFRDKKSLSIAAAEQASTTLRHAIHDRGRARIVVATGTSGWRLDALATARYRLAARGDLPPGIYVGLPITHQASFRKYLLKLIHKAGIPHYHLLDGEGHPGGVISLEKPARSRRRSMLHYAGIGDDAHLAFNDPRPSSIPRSLISSSSSMKPAAASKWAKAGSKYSDVPRQAISMSITTRPASTRNHCRRPRRSEGPRGETVRRRRNHSMAPASILRRFRPPHLPRSRIREQLDLGKASRVCRCRIKTQMIKLTPTQLPGPMAIPCRGGACHARRQLRLGAHSGRERRGASWTIRCRATPARNPLIALVDRAACCSPPR